MLGLVLTAGGARGAYQAGVLKRLGEIPGLRDRPSPFAIVAGASAGAINGTLLAAHGARFGEAAREIARLWSSLRVEDVFASDGCSLARAGAGLAFDFTLGALLGRTRTHGLVDTAPLGRLLERSFPPRGIAQGIRSGRLYAVAVTATSYHSGRSFTFVEGRAGHPVWAKSRRLVLPVSADQPTRDGVVGDPDRVPAGAGLLAGGRPLVRRRRPASRHAAQPRHPARRLAHPERRACARAAPPIRWRARRRGPCRAPGEGPPRLPCPPLAQVTGVFLNAIFLDHLDADLDHLARMNEIVASGRRDTAGLARASRSGAWRRCARLSVGGPRPGRAALRAPHAARGPLPARGPRNAGRAERGPDELPALRRRLHAHAGGARPSRRRRAHRGARGLPETRAGGCLEPRGAARGRLRIRSPVGGRSPRSCSERDLRPRS